MKKKSLWILWGCLYGLCVFLGFITPDSTAGSVVLTLVGLSSFIPGFLLLYRGYKEEDFLLLRRVRQISLFSLGLTMLLIVVTILCVGAGNTVGVILNILLNIVSAPMFCLSFQSVSPFLWACMLMVSFPRILKK